MSKPARRSNRKVAHVLWSGSFGGMTRAVYQLIRAQVEGSTYQPVLILAQGGHHYFDALAEHGVRVIDLGLESDRQIHRARSLAKVFAEFDIHHFHATEMTMVAASLLAGPAVRVFTNRAGYAEHAGLRRMRYAVAGWYLRNHFHGFSGNTAHACRAGERLFGVPLEKWQVTYNGLELSLHDATRPREEILAELGIADDGATLIGTAAELRDWKRIDMLIDACARLPHESFRLLVLGNGPSLEALRERARERGIADRTIFAGAVRRVGDYMRAMDVFVLPSTELESFGNAAVEAMYQGTATVVCSDGGGLLEHVHDGETGRVVGSIDDLARCLGELGADAAQCERLGAAGREHVTSSYTLSRMIASYNDLYRVAEERAATAQR
jgi:glycosyltransferase involved in cell wall biosynthesis